MYLYSFWTRMVAFATPTASQRLGESLQRYVRAIGVEAEDREGGIVRSIENFLPLRRDTAATKCVMDVLLLQHDISEKIMTHPSIEKLTVKSMDIQIFINVNGCGTLFIFWIMTESFE